MSRNLLHLVAAHDLRHLTKRAYTGFTTAGGDQRALQDVQNAQAAGDDQIKKMREVSQARDAANNQAYDRDFGYHPNPQADAVEARAGLKAHDQYVATHPTDRVETVSPQDRSSITSKSFHQGVPPSIPQPSFKSPTPPSPNTALSSNYVPPSFTPPGVPAYDSTSTKPTSASIPKDFLQADASGQRFGQSASNAVPVNTPGSSQVKQTPTPEASTANTVSGVSSAAPTVPSAVKPSTPASSPTPPAPSSAAITPSPGGFSFGAGSVEKHNPTGDAYAPSNNYVAPQTHNVRLIGNEGVGTVTDTGVTHSMAPNSSRTGSGNIYTNRATVGGPGAYVSDPTTPEQAASIQRHYQTPGGALPSAPGSITGKSPGFAPTSSAAPSASPASNYVAPSIAKPSTSVPSSTPQGGSNSTLGSTPSLGGSHLGSVPSLGGAYLGSTPSLRGTPGIGGAHLGGTPSLGSSPKLTGAPTGLGPIHH